MSDTASAPNFIGIDLYGPIVRAAVVSSDGEVIARRESPLDREQVVAQVTAIDTEQLGATARLPLAGHGQ